MNKKIKLNVKSFYSIMNERELIKTKDGNKFSKEEIETILISLKGKEYSKKEIIKEIGELLNIEVTESIFRKILESGIINKDGRIYSYNNEILNKAKIEDLESMEVGDGKVKSFSKFSAKKSKKYRMPKTSKSDKFPKFVKSVLLNMINSSKGQEKGSLLLKGDPGTGKTSSMEQLADILGMKIVTIEAPHVSEDAIISVPYLVKVGLNSENKVMEMKEDKNISTGFEVVSAESSLISDLKSRKPMKLAEWDRAVNKYQHLSKIRNDFIKPINKIRKTYNTILFIDEFYRTGSKRIQNLFRTILNGYIGDSPIPKNIYIAFASNMDNTDGSLDEIPLNHQFSALNFDKPSKDDFMSYIGSKFGGEEGEEENSVVKPEVFNKFMEVLSDEDIGIRDSETNIRISPRRWEEIIKYVSNGIPPKDYKDAEALVKFVYTNMRDYQDNVFSSKSEKYVDLIKNLIKENSNFNVDAVREPRPDEWNMLFEQQIKYKMEMGAERKYILSLAGKPGVGKTSTMRSLSKELGMKLIEIDCSTLNSDDVVGLTTPEEFDGVLRTKFTAPPLWTKIMNQYDSDISIPGSAYTHILFLDELSRTSKRVMNAIRSLMLEKKVNANFSIPSDMMIVTALNPKDVGAEELSDHLADVMDIIDVEVKISELFKYIKSKESNKDSNNAIGFDITSKMVNIFRELIDILESEENTDGEPILGNSRKWYWQWEGNIVYVSPREIDDMISGSIGQAVSELIDFEDYNPKESYTDEEYLNFMDIIKENMILKTKEVISFIAENKHNLDSPAMESLYSLIEFRFNSENFEELMDIHSDNIASIKSIIEDSDFDFNSILEYDEIGEIIATYISSVEPEEAVSNVSDIIDIIVNDYSSTPTEFIDHIIDFYKVVNTCDFSEFSAKISSNITEAFLQRGLKPYSKKLLSDAIKTNRNFTDEVDSHKYFNILEDLSNKNNYFL